MGQIFSWIRGTRDPPALQDVAVEQQDVTVQQQSQQSSAAAPAALKPAEYEKGSASARKSGSSPAAPAVQKAAVTKPTGPGPAGQKAEGVKPAEKSQSPGLVKMDPAAGKTSAAQKQSSSPKVEVEVTPASPAEAADPMDALAGTLPSSKPLAPEAPQFTGPKVEEPRVKPDKAVICGERESSQPPGRRLEEGGKKNAAGVPEKPKDVPKPISTDEALDSLSSGFDSASPAAAVKTDVKVESIGAVDARSSGGSNFSAPPSQQKRQTPPPPAPPDTCPADAAPADKKAKLHTACEVSSAAAAPPSKAQTDTISSDALGELSDTLAAPETPKPLPEVKPADVVHEKDVTSQKGVRVGERDDTLPPDYRPSEEELKKHPAPKKEPSLNTEDALDLLSGDFTAPEPTPVVKAPPPPAQEKPKAAGAPEKTKEAHKDTKSTPGAPEKTKAVPKAVVEKCSPSEAVSAKSAPQVSSAVGTKVPPGPKQKPQTDEDPFLALSDTLAAPETPKPLPEVKPADVVHEKDVTSQKGVRVGERDDTLPPDYRPSEEELKKHPAPKKEPSLDPAEALDILSGDFSEDQVPAKSAEFVAPSSASSVQSSAAPHADRQLSLGTSSALDALSDTLAEIKPAPEPAPVQPKDIVTEKNIVEEIVSKPGERDDSLPPDQRKALKEATKKAAVPKKPSLDDASALDLLSGDFSAVPSVSPSDPEAQSFTPEPTPAPFKASGPVMDQLADKLIPNQPDSKVKDKPKAKPLKPKSRGKKPALEESPDLLSGPSSSDVLPSSSRATEKR